MRERRATVERETTETKIRVELDLHGGEVSVASGVPFFDHMLDQVGRHARFGLAVTAEGDLEVDAHHTVEDTGIALGEALTTALGDKRGIKRFGDALVPMEEALAQVAVDISGRPLVVYAAELGTDAIGRFDPALAEEFLQGFARGGGLTLHVALHRGKNVHHCVEAIFKGLARALAEAIEIDPRAADVIPSTKGRL